MSLLLQNKYMFIKYIVFIIYELYFHAIEFE
jgi:hypothetical protein